MGWEGSPVTAWRLFPPATTVDPVAATREAVDGDPAPTLVVLQQSGFYLPILLLVLAGVLLVRFG